MRCYPTIIWYRCPFGPPTHEYPLLLVRSRDERRSMRLFLGHMSGELTSMPLFLVHMRGERTSMPLFLGHMRGERTSMPLFLVDIRGERTSMPLVLVDVHGERTSMQLVLARMRDGSTRSRSVGMVFRPPLHRPLRSLSTGLKANTSTRCKACPARGVRVRIRENPVPRIRVFP